MQYVLGKSRNYDILINRALFCRIDRFWYNQMVQNAKHIKRYTVKKFTLSIFPLQPVLIHKMEITFICFSELLQMFFMQI